MDHAGHIDTAAARIVALAEGTDLVHRADLRGLSRHVQCRIDRKRDDPWAVHGFYGRMKTRGVSSSRLSAAATSSAAISSFERLALNSRIASDSRQRATTSSETDRPAASASAACTCLETI